MKKGKIQLKLGRGGVAYLYLPDHPKKLAVGRVVKQVRLLDIYPDYEGPDLYFDFDKKNRLIGVEILAF